MLGSRAAVLRRSEGTCFSSPSDDEVGGYRARSARSERQRAEQSSMSRMGVERLASEGEMRFAEGLALRRVGVDQGCDV